MKSHTALLAQLAQLDAEIAAVRRAERNAVLEKIRAMMSEYGITPADLDERRDRRFATPGNAPEYMNPATGQVWSGRGRPPHWLNSKNRELYRIVPLTHSRDQNPVCTTNFRDITGTEWQRIAPLLPELQRRSPTPGRPRADTRAVFNGVLWVLYTGSPWSAMPRNYPPHPTCYRRFRIWHDSGALRRVADVLSDSPCGELHDLIVSRTGLRPSHAADRNHGQPEHEEALSH
jgi:transposase/DNA-binding protein H-NS